MIIISAFGKSDFSDFCEMHHSPEEVINNFEVYVGVDSIIPLRITSKKDLVAYYPYITAIVTSNNGVGCIHLSSVSQIDSAEEESLQFNLDTLKRYYRKCKRKKEPFDKTEAMSLIHWFNDEPKEYEIQLVDRVAKLGEKATIEGIHKPYSDRMRKQWYDLMLDNGWEETKAYRWVYGWQRWIDKMKADKYGEGYVQERLDLDDNNSEK